MVDRTKELDHETSTILVTLGEDGVEISKRSFAEVFDNSVARTRANYMHAIESGRISFAELKELAIVADVPYAILFAPEDFVDAQLKRKTRLNLEGQTKSHFSINTRSTVRLSDIELILKDLLRKQVALKKLDDSLGLNQIIGAIANTSRTPQESATILMDRLSFKPSILWETRTKAEALEMMIAVLESNQILVSQSQNNYMPQRLHNIEFSGLTVNDKKVPYIFLAGGSSDEKEEPEGRKLFTLTLMAVLVGRRIFAPVTFGSMTLGHAESYEYEVVANILMPETEMRKLSPTGLDGIRELAEYLKVTPSAITVRAHRLNQLTTMEATTYLDALRRDFASVRGVPRTPKLANAVRKYNGREFSKRMLTAHSDGKISARELCRLLSPNKLKPKDLGEFSYAVFER